MSILDVAAGSAVKSASGPQTFAALRDPVYDEATGRTYQLVARDGDAIPFCLSGKGDVKGSVLLDALNSARSLNHERNALKDVKTASADAERTRIGKALKALPTFAAERTDRTARMFMVYADRGVE